MCFFGGSDGKQSAGNAGNPGSIPGSVRSPGGGNDNPLHYSCPGNPMERGAWQTTSPCCCKELDITDRLHFLSFFLLPNIIIGTCGMQRRGV